MPERVLVVSIDGLAPRFITPGTMPNLCSLARSGASCFTARTVVPPLTVPAHASMLRGVDPATHGLVDNTPIPPRGNAPSFLAAARAAGLTTASVICWPPMDLLVEPHASQYRVSLDSGYDPHDDDVVTGETIDVLHRHRPDVTLTYLVSTDLAGHAAGWGSGDYFAAATRIDALLADLVAAAGPGSAVLVTTDHGGAGRGHFEPVDDVLETFVVVRSARIAPASMWAQASILDVAPTVADLAGVDAADTWIGVSLVGDEHAIVDHLLGVIATMGEHSYGERVDMLQHSLQTAACARAAGEPTHSCSPRCSTTSVMSSATTAPACGGCPTTPRSAPAISNSGCRPTSSNRSAATSPPSATSSPPTPRIAISSARPRSSRCANRVARSATSRRSGSRSSRSPTRRSALRRHDDDGKVDGLDVASLAEYRGLLTRIRQC